MGSYENTFSVVVTTVASKTVLATVTISSDSGPVSVRLQVLMRYVLLYSLAKRARVSREGNSNVHLIMKDGGWFLFPETNKDEIR
jgi:hypothetical protein